MFRTNSVPPIPMIVREPSRETTGMRTREVRKPIPFSVPRLSYTVAVNIARGALVLTAALVIAWAPAVAVTEVMSDADVSYALAVANGSDATRSAFHAPYMVAVADPLIEQLEVITEFRRFVLSAEDQLKAGNWMMARGGFDQKGRTLKDLLRPLAGQVSIRARLRFHPQNNYVTLPAFDILLGEPTLLPLNATRTPHVTPASGEPGTRDVINGATVEMFYNAPTIDDRVLPVRMLFEGRELTRARVDFSRIQ